MNINLGVAGLEIISNAKNIEKRIDYVLSKLVDLSDDDQQNLLELSLMEDDK